MPGLWSWPDRWRQRCNDGNACNLPVGEPSFETVVGGAPSKPPEACHDIRHMGSPT